MIDIKMPGKDGITLGEEVARSCEDCMIIFITAYDDFEYIKRALQVGAIEYLLKPVRPTEILALLRKTVAILDEERQKKVQVDQLRSALKEANNLLKSGLLLSMIMDYYEDEGILAKRAEFMGIRELPSSLMVILPDAGPETVESEFGRYRVFKFVEEMYSKDDSVFLLFMSEEIILGSTLPWQQLPDLARELLEAIREELDTVVTIGLGGEGKKIKSLFHDAQLAARLGQFYMGSDNIYTYEMLLGILGEIGEQNVARENMLMNSVRRGNLIEAVDLVEEILSDIYFIGKGSVTFCQVRVSEMMVMIWRTARQSGIVESGSGELHSTHLKELSKCKSYNEVRKCMEVFLGSVFSKARTSDNTKVIREAMAYIEKNFKEDIKLKKLAKGIYISPDYFSRLFKKVAGCTYIDYITKVRMKNAKMLLKNPGLSIAQVSVMTGYSDPNYFSRVFKKNCGMSPSDYKEIHNA